MYDYLIVGAGFSGAVLAERLARILNKKVLLIDKRDHIGGNCFDSYDEKGILVHLYGPHIFHTNSSKVFQYLSQFTTWRKYEHRVLAHHNNINYPFPINRTTLNKLYNINLSNDNEVSSFLDEHRISYGNIQNSEELILSKIGPDLFNRFYKEYTIKQWGIEPKELKKEVCGRIPVRFNEDDRYFADEFQFMPEKGFNELFRSILSHQNINLELNTNYHDLSDSGVFKKIIYTGPIDEYFNYKHGKLPYRSLSFKFKNLEQEYHQEVAQINYVDKIEEFTRIVEHKHLTGQKASTTTISKEFSLNEGEPYYPIPTFESDKLFQKYYEEALGLKDVIFCGRLAEYKYFNMDQVVENSLNIFEKIQNEQL